MFSLLIKAEGVGICWVTLPTYLAANTGTQDVSTCLILQLHQDTQAKMRADSRLHVSCLPSSYFTSQCKEPRTELCNQGRLLQLSL